jgi:hypothetical protein
VGDDGATEIASDLDEKVEAELGKIMSMTSRRLCCAARNGRKGQRAACPIGSVKTSESPLPQAAPILSILPLCP